jgi:hypothetical protein
MTAARQAGKPHQAGLCAAIAAALALFGANPFAAFVAGAETPLVVNAETGLAISGFDPVAYFTDKMPKIGRPGPELPYDGSVWRFVNVGNRAAFAEHPEGYMPRFGGYDPAAIARGGSVRGYPIGR